MDILVTLVFCLVSAIALWRLRASESRRKKRRRHKQREPLGAVLFGSYYYWYKVNHQLIKNGDVWQALTVADYNVETIYGDPGYAGLDARMMM